MTDLIEACWNRPIHLKPCVKKMITKNHNFLKYIRLYELIHYYLYLTPNFHVPKHTPLLHPLPSYWITRLTNK